MSERVLSEEESRDLLMKIKGAAMASAFGINALPEKELFERLEGLYLQGMEHGQALGIERGRAVKPLDVSDLPSDIAANVQARHTRHVLSLLEN